MTAVLKVLTDYCDKYVDDVRLTELKTTDFPLWAFKMWAYLNSGLPFFTIPSEMLSYLVGEDGEKLTTPLFGTFQTVTEEDHAAGVSFTINSTYVDYDYCSARIVGRKQNGDVFYTPLPSAYNSETGDIEVTPQSDIPTGATIEIDLYKDGAFEENLRMDVMRILGLCFACAWELRFINDWLSNVSKIEDSSFYEQNRANKENADTERYKMLKGELDSAMRRLDTNNEYRNVVLGRRTGY